MEARQGRFTAANIPNDCVVRLTQAALPAGATTAATLLVKHEGRLLTILTLDPSRAHFHSSMDVLVRYGQEVLFSAESVGRSGNNTAGEVVLHLTGFIQPCEEAEDDDAFMMDDDDYDDEDGAFGDDEEEED